MSEFRLLLYSYESSAKIAQASAMRIYSQIAERRFIFCKDRQLNWYCQTFLHLKTFSSFFPPFYLFTLLKLRVDSPYYFPLASGATTNLVFAAESHRPYSCYSRYSCSFKSTATETSVSYSCHSRYSCSLNHSSNRDNRPIRVRFALLLLVDQWVFDKSRVRLPYTNFSPLFICTSFTNFLTSADESSFLHINSTLSSSATI